jgi:hypothetical protein
VTTLIDKFHLEEGVKMEDSSKEKRRYSRSLVSDILTSAIIKPIGGGAKVWGMVVDSSSRGVMVSLPKEIATDTKVDISITHQTEDGPMDSKQYLGRICWCEPDELMENTFNIGIEFLKLRVIK